MNDLSFIGLIQNAALLLALVLVFDVFALRWRAGQDTLSRRRLLAGLIIGVIGVAVMTTPWVLVPGLVFDTRSVLLSISGLFFGTAPTFIAMVITTSLRLYQGGPGVWPGVSTVLVTGSLGLVWRRARRGTLDEITLPELYLFGLVIHLVMLGLMFTLPWDMALHTLRNISAPVLLIYPLATALLGGLMVNRLKREKLTGERSEAESQREAALEALRAERDLVSRIMETSPVGIAMVNKEGQIVFANSQAEQVLGLSRDEIHQRTYNDPEWRITDYNGGPFPEDALPFVQAQRTLQPVADVRHAIEWPDGRRVLLQISAAPLLDERGAFNGIIASVEDVTERRHQEIERATLLEAEHEQRLRAETLRDVTLALASALDISDVLMEILIQAQRLAPSVATNIALVAGDALHIAGQRGYAGRSADSDLTEVIQLFSEFPINAQIIADGQPYLSSDVSSDPRWRPQPATAWIRAHLSLPLRLGERVLGVLRLDSDQAGAFTAADVERLSPLTRAAAIALENAQLYAQAQWELEERKRSQAALQASERKFREMLENVHLFAVILDLEGHVTFCNDFGLDLLGMESSGILGRNWIETFIPPESRAEMRATFLQHFADGDFLLHHENKVLTASAERRLIAWNNMVLRDSDGVITGVAAVGEDITARRQAERALQASEAWLRSFVDSMDDVIFSLDTEQRHTALYGGWLERLGLAEEHFLGHTPREVFGPEAARVHETANAQALTTETSVTYEWEVNNRHFQTTLSPLRGPQDEVIGLVGVGRDITALKDYQAQLQTALDEKTLMLSEIHHRIKNNLQVILGLLDLQFAAVEDEMTQQMLHESQNRIKVIALIHEQLYQTPGEARVNAYFYFQSLTRYLTQTYDAQVRGIVVDLAIEPLELDIDLAIPCALIVNELIANALKYAFPPTWQSPDGAPPTLRVTLRHADDRARLEVADNGVGLPADVALEAAPRLGWRLIRMLARQIEGELLVEQQAGTSIAVTFAWNEER